jgi:hypothetical protein
MLLKIRIRLQFYRRFYPRFTLECGSDWMNRGCHLFPQEYTLVERS